MDGSFINLEIADIQVADPYHHLRHDIEALRIKQEKHASLKQFYEFFKEKQDYHNITLEEVKKFALTKGKEGKKRLKLVESVFAQEKKILE